HDLLIHLIFFFNLAPPTNIYTLSLHDALPILGTTPNEYLAVLRINAASRLLRTTELSVKEIASACGFQSHSHFSQLFRRYKGERSEEHTSELQSRENLVCRLLLEKKNT